MEKIRKKLQKSENFGLIQTMNISAEKLVSDALSMPKSIRAFVAEQILESLDIDSNAELSPEWKKEVEKRCRELDEGTVNLIEAEEVFKKAYARLS